MGYLNSYYGASLNAFSFVLEHFSCKEENERRIPLALNIRLEFSEYTFVE